MRYFRGALVAACALVAAGCSDGVTDPSLNTLSLPQLLPSHTDLRTELQQIVSQDNGGLGFEMWATVLDRNGIVVEVVFSGELRGDQWPGSRVISAQKANTANAFSLEGFALSTANLYAPVQPGGSLFGLQESNPVDPRVAYGGKPSDFGTRKDFMIGKAIGGINVFGGGLALYTTTGELIGGIGLSGDTSCTDHIIAWKLRHSLNLDNVPAGVGAGNTDNIIFSPDATIDGFEHPRCDAGAVAIAEDLPGDFPVGPTP
jgi:uncharacterized protein GlcG (DUF336 family)